MALNEKDLLELANLYTEIDPNLSSTILQFANARMADKLLSETNPVSSLEEWLMSILLATTNRALYEVSYGTWLVTGGTEQEQNNGEN